MVHCNSLDWSVILLLYFTAWHLHVFAHPFIDTSSESGEDLCEVCGSNAECRIVDGRPVCTCLPGFLGAPPNCHPECIVNRDCSTTEACNKQKCVDPCIGACGTNADCRVINHSPVCTCLPGYTGEPFVRCNRIPVGKNKKSYFPSLFQLVILHTGVGSLSVSKSILIYICSIYSPANSCTSCYGTSWSMPWGNLWSECQLPCAGNSWHLYLHWRLLW